MPAKMHEALIQRMLQSDSVSNRDQAYAIAKERGWFKQKGEHIVMTDEGRKAARNAVRHLDDNGWRWTGSRWRK